MPRAATRTSPSAAAAAALAARREREGVLLAIVAAFGFAAMVVMAKLAYRGGANVVTLLSVRFTIAAVLLWALAARAGSLRLPSRRDALAALALGGIVYSVETMLAFGALERIDAGLTELLIFSYPALVVLGAIVLRHESASRRSLAALALAMAGVALVLVGGSGDGGGADGIGIALALGAGVCYAAYVLVSGRIVHRLDALTFPALVCTGTAIALVLVGGASGTLHPAMSLGAWGWSIAIAVGSTVIAVSASLASVARLGAGRASILGTLEPPLACLLAFLVFDERLAPAQIAGGALVVAAALVLQVRSVRSLRRGASPVTAAPAAARPLAHDAADGGRMGVRAQVGRLPRARVRGREPDAAPVARR